MGICSSFVKLNRATSQVEEGLTTAVKRKVEGDLCVPGVEPSPKVPRTDASSTPPDVPPCEPSTSTGITASGHPPPSSASNDLSSLLESLSCPLCMGTYISPVTVLCGHTFCEFCLEEWYKANTGNLTCPTCRDKLQRGKKPKQAVDLKRMIEEAYEKLPEEQKEERRQALEERQAQIQAQKQISLFQLKLRNERRNNDERLFVHKEGLIVDKEGLIVDEDGLIIYEEDTEDYERSRAFGIRQELCPLLDENQSKLQLCWEGGSKVKSWLPLRSDVPTLAVTLLSSKALLEYWFRKPSLKMKLLWLLVLFGVCTAASTKDDSKVDGWAPLRKFNKEYYLLKNSVTDAILSLMEQIKEGMVAGGLDPFLKDLFTWTINNQNTDLALELNGLSVTGGSNFVNPHVDFNLIRLTLAMNFTWENLLVHADRYWIDGTLFHIIPLYGEGAADLQVGGLQINGAAQLSGANDQLSMTSFIFDVSFDSLYGNLEGFLGDLGQEINDIINTLGQDIFNLIKNGIIEDVQTLIIATFNQAVDGLSLQDVLDMLLGNGGGKSILELPFEAPKTALALPKENANEYVDRIMENVRALILANGWDNFDLPDQIAEFSETVLGITWHGSATMTQGFLNGLETISRAGDAALELIGEGINIRTSLGFNDLFGGYRMRVEFMGIGLTAYAEVTIRTLEFYLDATVTIGDETTPTQAIINEFKIGNPGYISINITGLGPLNFILELLGGIILNIFDGLIVGAISDNLQNLLQEILDNLTQPPTQFLTML
ncbi:unnamed protein product [Cyprideis torosa]|uniref:Uncharacterized protein n=1 Tax=Cyprideis torosa TaxID=163714 RepID=A0A7R8WNM3_9CRUS|nr:unnamed protein product [Cyprideis torosa]CAG0899755.1 unnamed protein product [Cyprideis torosa]